MIKTIPDNFTLNEFDITLPGKDQEHEQLFLPNLEESRMVCAALQDIDYIFKICFYGEISTVKQIIYRVLQFLKDNISSLSEEDALDLKLIYTELLVNAVIHGNKMDINKSVYLFVEAMDNIVYSTISDEGSGFDHMKVLTKAKSPENISKDSLEETGRGICLVYSLTSYLAYNRLGNQVTFYKSIGRKGCSSLKE